MTAYAHLADNVAHVNAMIAAACARAERPVESVKLVAVSKTHPAAAVLRAVAAGLQHFGENRVEESIGKIAEVNRSLEQRPLWHMIGHVQSRKARDVGPLFDLVHSVDSVRLAQRLASAVGERTLAVLLEMNVSGEATKAGFAAADWQRDPTVRRDLVTAVQAIAAMPDLRVVGLMTMAPVVQDMEEARWVFRALRSLRDALQQETGLALPELSMGMSDDYPVAIEEGATLVRIGRAIFGERMT